MKKVLGWLLTLSLVCANVLGVAAQQEETYQIGDLAVPYQQQQAEQLQALGLMEGTENGLDLQSKMTRAQAVTMLVRLLGESAAQAENPFEDVRGHWAEDAIAYANQQGYVKGVGGYLFEPERMVTGAEFCTMLLRAFGYAAEPDTAYELGVGAGMLLNTYTKAAVKTADYELNRSDMAGICCGALLAKTADGPVVKDVLMEKGVFTEAQWDSVMIAEGLPENTGFAWKLNALMPADENYMFSPLSIQMAFAMAANGAAGQTQQEMLDVLEISDLDAFNQKAAQLIESYNAKEELQLQVANSIWRNTDQLPGLEFAQEYQKTIEEFYQGEIADVTDKNAVETINGWVKDKTHDKIDSITENSDFYAMLVNAVYFKGTWANQFSEAATSPEPFTDRDGTVTQIDFMHDTGYMEYYADEHVQMVSLPYRGGDISMYIALTDQPGSYLEEAADNMQSSFVQLSLPKFRVEFETSLNGMMQQLGMQEAFDKENADFSPMLGGKLLFIDTTLHKTYIDVDENGTEAAAVTGISAGGSAAPINPPIEFKADRPFTYFIRDNTSGEILFLGQYAYAD